MEKGVFIISAVRTAIGRYGGSLRTVTSGELGAVVIKEGLKRSGVSPERVDEVIMGEVRQSTESANMARVAALRAGLPEEVPAYTVNRLCASAMEALYSGYLRIASGEAGIVVAGGAENMSRAPYYIRGARWGDGTVQLIDSNLEGGPGAQPNETYGPDLSMGMTAENVAEKYNITREDQDIFALRSQRLAAAAISGGRFKDEIVPVEITAKKKTMLFDTDEFPRPETTLEVLAGLKPAFKKGGSVTAGNSCGRNDGAAAMVLASGRAVKEFGLTPLGRLLGFSAAGVSPRHMGIGPVPAVKKLLAKLNLTLGDIDLVELNEAFASQALACIRELGLDLDRTNVNGGGIALGHPLGATGCRLCVTLLHEMKRRNARLGLATLCVGGGQGMAAVIENI
ncbi:MAG: thiolase family protein [Bacillota bacterium]